MSLKERLRQPGNMVLGIPMEPAQKRLRTLDQRVRTAKNGSELGRPPKKGADRPPNLAPPEMGHSANTYSVRGRAKRSLKLSQSSRLFLSTYLLGC